jgi:molecular chaperone HtpG
MDKCYLVRDTDGAFYTLDEIKEKVEVLHKDKNEKIILLYTHDEVEHHSFIAQAKERGYTVLVMDSPLTSHMLMKLEQKHTDFSFTRVDSNSIDKLIDKGEELPSKLTSEQEEALKPMVQALVDEKKYQVELTPMSETDAPMVITQSEFMRRMKEQQQSGGGGMMMGMMPEMYNLVVNSNHPLVAQIVEEKKDEKKKALTQQALDLAMLSQGMLKGERLTTFIQRSIDLIK